MSTTKRIAGLLALAMLSACSGGGSGARVAPTSQNGANSGSAMNAVKRTAMVQIAFRVPAGLGKARLGSSTRSLQYTSPSVKGAIAVQLCNDSEALNGSSDGTTQCKNGTIFTLDYDVTNLAVCPTYSPNTPFSCTLNFPAGRSSGSQFELDLYDQAPRGGTNGVGGVISQGNDASVPLTARSRLPMVAASGNGSCGNGQQPSSSSRNVSVVSAPAACLLGAGLSDPDLAVPLAANNQQVAISQIQGFIQIIETGPNAGFPGSFIGGVPTFVASKQGNAAGTHITGSALSLGFDAQNNDIASGACVQDSGPEYANALTPAADEAPSPSPGVDQRTGNVGGPTYHRDNGGRLNVATGLGARNAAQLVGTETYGGITYGGGGGGGGGDPSPLTSFFITPCLVGGPGRIQFGAGTGIAIGIGNPAAINFPDDSVDFFYSGANSAPTQTQVGSNGDTISQGIGYTIPYYAQVTGTTRGYVGYEQNNPTSQPSSLGSHEVEPQSAALIIAPLWGELANPSTPPWCPSPTCTTPTGSFTTGVWTNQQGPLLANMQGTNSTIQVNALQAYLPSGGSYSALVPGNCAGIVAVQSGPSAPLFITGGAAWTMVSGLTSGTCVVTYTDSFNSFSVTFTNTGRPNPASPGPGTPAPTLSPFGGPTAPGTPTV